MAAPQQDLTGRELAGYQILALIGEGGMGLVYKARQISLDRIVAVKTLGVQFSQDEEWVARFQREARSIAKVNHPNILQVYDVGQEDGLHYIAMEFIDGETLTDRLQARGYVEWRECARVIQQAALGLAAAANASIIHRDIKPDNLMITGEGVVKVSDFGLAKEVENNQELTQVGDLMGTPAYMSPEQCDGAPLDTRTDIYSLGATFYRAVTGMLPFNAPTAVAMMYKQKHEPLIGPKEYMPTLPDGVCHIIERMMAKEPAQRYRKMEDVVLAIDNALAGKDPDEGVKTVKFDSGTYQAYEKHKSTTMERRADFEIPSTGSTNMVNRPGEAGDQFAQLVHLGDEFLAKNRPVAACDCWRRALKIHPDAAEVKKRIDDAKEASTVASLQIGEALMEQGRLNAVRTELQAILQANPDDIDAREKLAAIEYVESRKREGVREVRNLLGAGEYEKALVFWDSIPEKLRDKTLQPQLNHIRDHVIPCKQVAKEAQALVESGHFEDAIVKFDEAMDLDSSNDKVKLARQEAVRLYDAMEHAMREGYEFNVKRQYDSAISCFEKVLELCPHNTQAKRYMQESYTELARASEGAFEYEKAIELWRKVLDLTPGNQDAMAQLEGATRKKQALQTAVEAAQAAGKAGQYGAAIRQWREALMLQPTNSAFERSLDEARSLRFRRRVLPVVVLLFAAVAGVVAVQYYKFQNLMETGDRKRRDAGPKELGLYDDAVADWKRAELVLGFGSWHNDQIRQRIGSAEVAKAIDQGDLQYQGGRLDALRGHLRAIVELGKTKRAFFPQGGSEAVAVQIQWQIADLLRQRKEYAEALAVYRTANEMARKSKRPIVIPPEQQRYFHGLTAYYLARDISENDQIPNAEREKQYIAKLEEAIEKYPDLLPAREDLIRAKTSMETRDEAMKRAGKFLAVGRRQIAAGRYDSAMDNFRNAAEEARKVLSLSPNNWDALKIVKEYEWRAEAGAEMVFFLFPYHNDKQAKEDFRAFALDRYEWPNTKGAVPQSVTFPEAVKLAKDAGKVLPTYEEWYFAASSDSKFIYAGGNDYDRERYPTEVIERRPQPSGSHPAGATPVGVHDMTGNLAEWLATPGRPVDDETQITIGGHFASGDEAVNDRNVPLRGKIRHAEVGFRAAKRWELKRKR